MDSKLGVQHNGSISKPPVHHHSGGGLRGRTQQGGGKTKGIKVVYISSPMMLTASAEEFRAVVQELTGRDSNVADHDLAAGGAYYYAAGALPSSSSSTTTSSSSSSYSSFGRVSPTAAGARAALPSSPTMATGASAGAGRAAEYGAAMMAAPPPFQSMYDQTAGSLLYGQDFW